MWVTLTSNYTHTHVTKGRRSLWLPCLLVAHLHLLVECSRLTTHQHVKNSRRFGC